MRTETIAIHGNYHPNSPGDPATEPLINSTTFRHPADGLDRDGYSYTRHNNPNREHLEKTLATLEGGSDAACFSSGMAATAAVFQSLEPGDHIIFPKDVYHGTRAIIHSVFNRWGLTSDEADMRNVQEVESLIRPETKLIWLETPSNPLLHITDISEIRKIAKNDILICTDNTWMTPILQKPLALGSDLVVHSTTKFIGGHSDLLGGAVISRSNLNFFDKIRHHQQLGGAVPSPYDCWMLSRSLKSLPARLKMHQENTNHVVAFLQQHPKVEQVFYPGLETHPGHKIFASQSEGFGAMLSFTVKGDQKTTLNVVNRAKIIIPATSLGGVESTWEHRKSSEGDESATPENLIRFSVGLEHHEDLIEDIRQALI